MTRRHTAILGLVILVGSAAAYAYDVSVVTDEERLEEFVDDVTGSMERGRITVAQERWMDLGRQPFDVSAMGRSLSYGEGEEAEVTERAETSLQTMYGTNLRVLNSSFVIEGDEARVTLNLLSRERGMGVVEWTLRRNGEDWLVSALRVQR